MTGLRSRAAAALLLLLAVTVLATGLLLGTAGPAAAHATLVATDPAEGAVLAEAPEAVTFTFSEPVIGVPTGVRVFDATGAEVASSTSVSDFQLQVSLDEEVGDGTLVVVWRLVSEDGHPVAGSLRFSVGAPSETVAAIPTGDDDVDAPWSLSLAKWLGYLGLLAGAGLVWFAALVLPARADRRRVVLAARGAAGVAAVAWVLAVPLLVDYQMGSLSAWRAMPATTYVVAAAVVLGLGASAVLLGNRAGARRAAAVVAATVAVVAPALTGHTRAATPEVLVVGADMVHLLAAAIWLGGLVGLALTLPELAGEGEAGAQVLARFSGIGAGVLVALLLTGLLQAWRIVGSWSSLVDSDYGRLLMVKVATVAVAVVMAGWNRYGLVPSLREAARSRDRQEVARRVVRAATVEAALLVGVVLVTSVLVDRSPDPPAAVVDSAQVRTSSLGEVSLRTTMDPAVAGPTVVTVEMTGADGAPFEGYDAPTVRLSSGTLDLGDVPVRSMAPGVYAADVVLPAAGDWRVQVSVRITEFENPVTTMVFTAAE